MSARRRPGGKASAPDPFAGRMAARLSQIAVEDAADDATRRERAGDLAWVTRERDGLLESVRLFAEAICKLQGGGDPEARAFAAAQMRRSLIDLGREALAAREGGDG